MFYSRKDYTVYTFSVGKRTLRFDEALELLKDYYPYELKKTQIFIKRIRNTNYVFVFNNEYDKAKELSTIFVLRKCKNFSGKVLFFDNQNCECCIIKNGVLKESYIAKSERESADIVFMPKGKSPSLYDLKNIQNIIFYNPSINHKQIKLITIGLAFFAILFMTLIFTKAYLGKIEQKRILHEQALNAQKQNEEKRTEQAKLVKECERLQKEYSDLYFTIPASPYFICNDVYNCLISSVKIKTLSIDRNSFSVEMTGKNAVNVLEKFENSSSLQNCVLLRTSFDSETGAQIFQISGEAKHIPENCDESLSENDKINWYITKIETLKERIKRNDNKPFSECTGEISAIATKYGNSIEYIQSIKDGDTLNLEINIKGIGKNIMSFIKDCSENWIVSSTRIRTFSGQRTLSCTMKIVTNTPISQDPNNPQQTTELSSPSEIGSSFSAGNTRSAAPAKTTPAQLLQISSKETITKVNYLTYIGKAVDADGKKCVLIKNTRLNEVLKISDYAETEDGKLIILLDNKKYEVAR